MPVEHQNLEGETIDPGSETIGHIESSSPQQSISQESESPTPNPPTHQASVMDVSGTWVLRDPDGNQSVLVFTQIGEEFNFREYNSFNMEIGSGSGEINNNQLFSDYFNSIVEIGGQISLSTNNGGRSWSGRVDFPTVNTSSRITLSRN